MFNFKKIRKNVKAISPVISVLLMIAVAVVASLVAYAWVMGYIGSQTGKTGQAVQIQSIAFAPTAIATDGNLMDVTTIYVQNVGTGTVSFNPVQSVFVEGVQVTSYAGSVVVSPNPTPTPTSTPILAGETAQINLNYGAFQPGTTITVKVTTEGGTYSQISQVVPEP
jgi:flagellin-like protein